LPAFDFVAIREHSVLNARAIQERAVAALAVLDATAARPALHGKVHAGHKRVVWQSKLRAPRRPPERYRLSGNHGNFLPGKRPRANFQKYAHFGLLCRFLYPSLLCGACFSRDSNHRRTQ
jgi:hypothetical protein